MGFALYAEDALERVDVQMGLGQQLLELVFSDPKLRSLDGADGVLLGMQN